MFTTSLESVLSRVLFLEWFQLELTQLVIISQNDSETQSHNFEKFQENFLITVATGETLIGGVHYKYNS